MNKKFILPLSLIILVGLAIFVSASYSSDKNQGSLIISKGWNLVPVASYELQKSDSEVKFSDFKYGYLYMGSKGYTLVFKDGNWIQNPNGLHGSWASNEEEAQKLIQSSMWVYSDVEGQLVFNWGQAGFNSELFQLSKYKLSKGYNFLFVTPEMAIGVIGNPSTARSLNDIKGDCTFEKVYSYKQDEGGWINLMSSLDDKRMLGENSAQMYGLVVKISDACSLGYNGEALPPSIPN